MNKTAFAIIKTWTSEPEYGAEIIAICSTREKAEKMLKILEICNNNCVEYSYEEYNLDTLPAINF